MSFFYTNGLREEAVFRAKTQIHGGREICAKVIIPQIVEKGNI
jgi:hypothetical protein